MNGLPTKARLQQSKVFFLQECVFCNHNSENTQYLFLNCRNFIKVWETTKQLSNQNIVIPHLDSKRSIIGLEKKKVSLATPRKNQRRPREVITIEREDHTSKMVIVSSKPKQRRVDLILRSTHMTLGTSSPQGSYLSGREGKSRDRGPGPLLTSIHTKHPQWLTRPCRRSGEEHQNQNG